MPEVIGSTSSLHTDDATPESLRNRISFTEMGIRTTHVGPQLSSTGVKPHSINGTVQLESFVFRFYSDVSVDVIRSAVQAIVTILKSEDLSEEEKKTEIEDIIGSNLESSQYDELKSIAQHVTSTDLGEDDEDVPMEDTFSENEDTASPQEEPETKSSFVALNDPIRFRNNNKVTPQEVDAHWLENKLRGTHVTAKTVIKILEEHYENADQKLQALFGLDNFAVYQIISSNKDIIFWYTKLAWALTGDERDLILEQINNRGLSVEDVTRNDTIMEDIPREVELKIVGIPLSGTRYMAAPGHAVQLPAGSTRFTTYNYEQYNIPSASDHVTTPEWPLVKIGDLPEYAQPAFNGINSLNIVQSKVHDSIMNTDVNVLLCAPTGAGKSNVALLALTKCLNSGFRCVCIAPLKALVQEQVTTLQSKLKKSGFVVAELSGDQALSREQLTSVDVIVATPEKWDVVTRKAANIELLRSIGLVVIDEIHLLHDEGRGSVLENIVVRHLRQKFPPRLVGLSATLPNYRDIGKFLQVPPSGLFFFDAKYRPVPLEQKYIGVTPQSPIKQLKAINEACAEKVKEIVVEQNKQVLIFVHSRKETETTRDMLHESFGATLTNQVGIHHAGLPRHVREESESLFKKGELRVLVSTATLAWGVNLPAAAVIIKGTEYYDPKQSGWCQLSPQDVLQMLGRAGRPGFDVEGLGIIITSHKFLNYFASVATLAMPIQSYLIKRLCESLNAEIAAKTIHSIDDCVEWLEKTFWYVRAKADPAMYGDNYTVADIAHSALIWLEKHEAITYEYPNKVKSTLLGELAANFYISPESISLYSQQLKPWLSDIDIIRVFSRSAEFASLPVRKSEEQEIKNLSNLAPIPVRDDADTRYAKVCVLLQTYISRLHLNGLALSSDLVYIAQSASRLFRAIFELSVAAKWGVLARRALRLYLMVDRRQWMVGQSPLRQFPDCPTEILARMETSQIPWQRYFDLNKEDLNRVLRLSSSSLASTAFSYLQKFPRFNINAVAQPVSIKWIWISIDITPLFDAAVQAEQYWMIIETTRGHILYSTRLSLNKLASGFSTTVPVELESVEGKSYTTPYLFVRLWSDKWLHCESDAPVNLRPVRPPNNISESTDIIQNTDDAVMLPEYENLPKLVQQLAPLFADSERSVFIGMFPSATYYASLQLVHDSAFKRGEKVLILSPDVNTLKQSLKLEPTVCVWDVAKAEQESRSTVRFNKLIDSVDCVICEGLQKLGSIDGYYYEALISRLRIALGSSARFVGFGYPVTSAQSIAQWIGAKKSDAYNFGFDSLVDSPVIDVQMQGSSLLVSLWDIIPTFDQNSTTLLVVGSHAEAMLVKEELDYRGFDSVEVVPLARKGTPKITTTTSTITICTSYQLSDTRELTADRIVIFMNTVSVSVSDLLTLTLHAKKQVTILTDNPGYCAACINSPIPLESNIHKLLEEVIAPEIVKGTIRLPQDAMNWIMSTFLYRRIRQNPSYYQSYDLQDWVSEIVETAFERLAKIKAVEFVDEETLEVEPLPACFIAANCGVPLGSLESTLPIITESKRSWLVNFTHNESNLRILDARIDMALANNNLSALFAALDQRQALVQSIPLGSSPLNQLPWIDNDGVNRCQDSGIHSIQDFVAIEDDDLRCHVLGFDNENPKMVDVAEFVNHFPIVDIVDAQLRGNKLCVSLERDMEPGEKPSVHAAPGYPSSSSENWFLIGADAEKSIVLFEKLEVIEPEMTLSFDVDPGKGQITIWLVCGSYIDADKEYTTS